MQVDTLIEMLEAGHHAHMIEGDFQERGGIMIVGPPGHLKTTCINLALKGYPDAIQASDLTLQQFVKMRQDFVSGRYSTIAFLDFEKLYERNPSTAKNLEGLVRSLTAEGFRHSSSEDTRGIAFPVQAFVIGAMTSDFAIRNVTRWIANGFQRRFLWCAVKIANSRMIGDAIEKWQKIEIGSQNGILRAVPRNKIKHDITEQEAATVRRFLIEQDGNEGIAFSLMVRMFCYLRWKYKKEPGKPMQLIKDFSKCLLKAGDVIAL